MPLVILPALRRPVRRFVPARPYGVEAWFLPSALCPYVGAGGRLAARREARRPAPRLRLPMDADCFAFPGAAGRPFLVRLVRRSDCRPGIVGDMPISARALSLRG